MAGGRKKVPRVLKRKGGSASPDDPASGPGGELWSESGVITVAAAAAVRFTERLLGSRHRNGCFICFTSLNATVLGARCFHTRFTARQFHREVQSPAQGHTASPQTAPEHALRPPKCREARSLAAGGGGGVRAPLSAPVGGGRGRTSRGRSLMGSCYYSQSKEQRLEVQKTEWVSLEQPLQYLPELYRVPELKHPPGR